MLAFAPSINSTNNFSRDQPSHPAIPWKPSSLEKMLQRRGFNDTLEVNVNRAKAVYNFMGLEHGSFLGGFLASLWVIFAVEIGDKTFFLAALMAMKHSRLAVLAGSMISLSLLTVIAALGGSIATELVSRKTIHYVSAALFLCFGCKMLFDGVFKSGSGAERECEEAEKELEEEEERRSKRRRRRHEKVEGAEIRAEAAEEPGQKKTQRKDFRACWPRLLREGIVELKGEEEVEEEEKRTLAATGFREVEASASQVELLFRQPKDTSAECWAPFVQAMLLTFLAEWGDRTQISTIMLAAEESVTGVTLGAISGHLLCTSMAVVGGRVCAKRISVKKISIFAGFVFIAFAVIIILLPA